MPRYAALSSVTSSLVIRSSIIGFAILDGMAKPMPSTVVSLYLDELMPITSPLLFKRAPPLLPGLMAASV